MPQPVLALELPAVKPLDAELVPLPPVVPVPVLEPEVAAEATFVGPPLAVTALAKNACDPFGPSLATVVAIASPTASDWLAANLPKPPPTAAFATLLSAGADRTAEVMEAAALAP